MYVVFSLTLLLITYSYNILAYGMIIFIINVYSYNCVLFDLLSHFSYFLRSKLLCQTPYPMAYYMYCFDTLLLFSILIISMYG